MSLSEAVHADYDFAVNYINGIQKFAKKNTLEHTKMFLQSLGNPGRRSRIIHVAGTNGKGSTCNYLRALLRAQGYHVGMFISPHLVTMRERILMDHDMITEQEFAACFETVYQQVQRHEGQEGWYHPTFFEYLFLMAMVYYEKKQPDYIILETGMGGRLDATNAIDDPVMTIITEIGLDHQQYLGDTKELIAGEKAGIIKSGVPLVYAKREESTAEILEKRAKELQAEVYPVDKTVFSQININDKGIDFCYNSRYYNDIDITLCTYAPYQAENAALALRAYELLCGESRMEKSRLQSVIGQTCWAGRMEQIMPGVFLDGAHNEDGINAFLECAECIPVSGKRILMFSVVSDKAYEEMMKRLVRSGLFAEYIVADLQDERGLAGAQAAFFLSQMTGQTVSVRHTVKAAMETALSHRTEQDVVFIVGSLYLVGEVKSCILL